METDEDAIKKILCDHGAWCPDGPSWEDMIDKLCDFVVMRSYKDYVLGLEHGQEEKKEEWIAGSL